MSKYRNTIWFFLFSVLSHLTFIVQVWQSFEYLLFVQWLCLDHYYIKTNFLPISNFGDIFFFLNLVSHYEKRSFEPRSKKVKYGNVYTVGDIHHCLIYKHLVQECGIWRIRKTAFRRDSTQPNGRYPLLARSQKEPRTSIEKYLIWNLFQRKLKLFLGIRNVNHKIAHIKGLFKWWISFIRVICNER